MTSLITCTYTKKKNVWSIFNFVLLIRITRYKLSAKESFDSNSNIPSDWFDQKPFQKNHSAV